MFAVDVFLKYFLLDPRPFFTVVQRTLAVSEITALQIIARGKNTLTRAAS